MAEHIKILKLASKSPRRAELLKQIGVEFSIADIEFDETPLENEAAQAYVVRMAQGKALRAAALNPNHPCLGADTIVYCNDGILGKPKDEMDAERMLTLLSGNTHYVMSAVAVCEGQNLEQVCVKTRVTFRLLSPQEIHSYCSSGEPLDKAGAYAIQGLAAVFVEQIEGSYSAVVGLPLMETAELLKKFGVLAHWCQTHSNETDPV